MMANFPAHTNGRESGYRRTGLYFLHPEEDVEQIREVAAGLRGIGIEVDVFDRSQLTRRFPRFDLEGIEAGAWEADGGYADPASTTIGLFERAAELGVEPRLRSGPVGIDARRGEIADGILVDAGTSGHGFKLAPALGKHVADLVAGNPVDPGLAQFHPSRFDEGHPLAAGYRSARILG